MSLGESLNRDENLSCSDCRETLGLFKVTGPDGTERCLDCATFPLKIREEDSQVGMPSEIPYRVASKYQRAIESNMGRTFEALIKDGGISPEALYLTVRGLGLFELNINAGRLESVSQEELRDFVLGLSG